MKSFWSVVSPLRFSLNRRMKSLVSQLNKNNLKILEIGAGKNSYKHYFPNSKWISTDLVKYAKIDEVADVTSLHYSDKSFDAVICISVLEHVFEIEKAVSEIRRVLKKNGTFVMSTPFIFPIHDNPQDYWRLTDNGIKNLLEKFSCVKIKPLVKIWWRTPIGYFVVAEK